MPSATNITKRKILARLYELGVFAWRQNTTGLYDAQKGVYRPAAKVGVADILATVPPNGRILTIEQKTGRDRLRPEQIGFAKSIEAVGGVAMFVSDFDDFESQLKTACPHLYR